MRIIRTFNPGTIVEARTKLADRPVVWEEKYTPKTLLLKRQYHEIVGPGSYFRFEGHDTDTNDDYFVIVGPAGARKAHAMFFAGVRKLPADYPAGGQEFHDMKDAMEYAVKTWGVPSISTMRYYDSSDLKGLSGKVSKWKEAHADDTDDASLQEWFENLPKEEHSMPTAEASHAVDYIYVQTDAYPYFVKIAMPVWLRQQSGFAWWDIDDILAGVDDSFNEARRTQPSLDAAKDFAARQRTKRREQIADFYGDEYLEADFYKVWLVHRPDKGTYIISVGPYCGRAFEGAKDKFGVFKWKLNLASQDEIDVKVRSLQQEYAEKYGVELTRDDIKVPLADHPMVGEITINRNGREKIFGSPEWKRLVLDRYGVQHGRGMMTELKERRDAEKAEWDRRLREAYAVSQENGEAFKREQPEPPSITLSKRSYGQQIATSIYREEPPEDMPQAEKVDKFGFNSIAEAVDHLNATVMQGAPIGDVPSTTAEDLTKARAKHDKQKASQPATVKPRSTPKPAVQVPQQQAPAAAPEVPAPAPAEEQHVPEFDAADLEGGGHDDLYAKTLDGMSKIANELERLGNVKAAEDIRRAVKKYGV